ncbi:MAG: OmpP1/FadL family transporter [Mangrovibacterium sp.]
MKRISYLVLVFLFSVPAVSQELADALRLSDYRLQGTARATAMGNAFGALGGDFTSASINPAGIGLYRSNEFSMTARLGENDIDASYLGSRSNQTKDHFSIPNVSYVTTFNSPSYNGSSLISINLGIGYNRMNDFNLKRLVYGEGATSSMLDGFVSNSDGKAPEALNKFYEKLAVYGQGANLIYDDDEDDYYEHDLQLYPGTNDFENYPHNQRKYYSQKGSVDEYIFSVAANFNHQFYLGGTIGIQDVYFRQRTSFSEWDANNSIPHFNEYTFDTYLKTTGTGYNFKLGMIYKPVDALRLGLALHTPTFYDLSDDYYNDMYSSIILDEETGAISEYTALSPYGEYDYELKTPMKAILSVAYVVGKTGLFSLDYEWIDYSNMELSDGADGNEFFDENALIEETMKSVGNLHVGAEYRLSGFFSLRAGYEYYPSPYKSTALGVEQPNSDADTNTYSFGIGWKAGGFYADLAYKYSTCDEYINLYSVPDTADPSAYSSPTARFSNDKNYLSFTLGFRF